MTLRTSKKINAGARPWSYVPVVTPEPNTPNFIKTLPMAGVEFVSSVDAMSLRVRDWMQAQ
jgi:hypothetical protein